VPVETLQKADKPESKTGMIVLGVVLAVSVLVNVGLCWKLWTGKKPREEIEGQPKKPEIAGERGDEEDNEAMRDMRERITVLDKWIDTFKYFIKQLYSEEQALKDSYTAMVVGLIEKDKEYFQTESPPNLEDAFEPEGY